MLFADAGRHGGAEQHRIHLDARAPQRIFDDVEIDRIDVDGLERRFIGFNNCGEHGAGSLTRRYGADQYIAEGVDLAVVAGQDQRG